MRIASLLPSATEIICSLGLRDQLVGVSHSCDFPEDIKGLPILTSTSVPVTASSAEIDNWVRQHLGNKESLYQIDLQTLEAVAADLVISQRLCDVCAVSSKDVDAALEGISSQPRLIDLNPACLADVFADIHCVAKAAGASEKGQQLVEELQNRVEKIASRSANIRKVDHPRVVMLEWLDPPFSSGHWNPELVELAGAIDCLGPKGQASLTVTWSSILESRPDVLVLCCCGFDIERTIEELAKLQSNDNWCELQKSVNGNIWLTDGNAFFSRPGPRLVDALEAMAHAFHPGVHAVPEQNIFRRLSD